MAGDPEAMREMGRALGRSCRALEDALAALGEGLAEGYGEVRSVDRAFREWRALPWYKRLWYWMVSTW